MTIGYRENLCDHTIYPGRYPFRSRPACSLRGVPNAHVGSVVKDLRISDVGADIELSQGLRRASPSGHGFGTEGRQLQGRGFHTGPAG